MFVSCVFAMVAQFFPIPFPASRPLLAVCCAAYFIISSLLQYFVTFVDKDTILFTKPKEVKIFVIFKISHHKLLSAAIEH
jgi:signal peptidase complex subunit 2